MTASPPSSPPSKSITPSAVTAPAQPGSPLLRHRTVLAIALPIMVSNISTPLLGLVDMAAIGRIGGAAPIGAVSLGALVFTFVFWGFNFLRMATTGLTAQAVGGQDSTAMVDHLGRAVLVALSAGVVLVMLQWPISTVGFALLDGSPGVEKLAADYVAIRFWSAPATLCNYALLGWFIGLGRARIALVLQLVLNLTNIGLDVTFVLGLGWGVRGVALGSVIAELLAAAVGLRMALGVLRSHGVPISLRRLRDVTAMRHTLAVNADIMIRSLSLISVFVWFTAQGARQGDDVLAANAMLMQLVGMASYVLDGIAYAAETLTGQAFGARNEARLRRVVWLSSGWAVASALALSTVFAFGGEWLIAALTPDVGLRRLAAVYLPWAATVPIAGVAAFQLDGIFIGATRAPAMRNAMLVSLLIFALAWWLLLPWGNHGLWASLFVHYAARTGTLLVGFPALLRACRPAPT